MSKTILSPYRKNSNENFSHRPNIFIKCPCYKDCLLYGYPNSNISETLIRIDGTDYCFYNHVYSISINGTKCISYADIAGTEKPDKVQIAAWPHVCGSAWNYQVNSNQEVTHDSAVVAYYDKGSLPANSECQVSTYYGAYDSNNADVYDEFNYSNTTYSQELAKICAGYSALAYEDYKYDSSSQTYYYGG